MVFHSLLDFLTDPIIAIWKKFLGDGIPMELIPKSGLEVTEILDATFVHD